MQQKNIFRAFTLPELLVAIAIISVLALGISQFNFNRLSQKQQIEIEVVKLISLIEDVRNNALIGRWVGTSLVTPTAWNITLSNDTSSGTILTQYYSGSLNTYNTWNTRFPFSIQEIRCENINGSNSTTSRRINLSFTWTLWGINSGCTWIVNPKIIEIDYGLPDLQKTIHFNLLSGVIEID